MTDYPEIAARFARDTAAHEMVVLPMPAGPDLRSVVHAALSSVQGTTHHLGLITLEVLTDRVTAAVAALTTDTTPIPLHWDRLVMHPNSSDDDQTVVACMTDDGRPAALFLDDELREALGLMLVDPDGEGVDE